MLWSFKDHPKFFVLLSLVTSRFLFKVLIKTIKRGKLEKAPFLFVYVW